MNPWWGLWAFLLGGAVTAIAMTLWAWGGSRDAIRS